MRRAAVSALLIAALAVGGCDGIIPSQPTVRDLVGVYRLTAESEEFLRTRKGYEAIPPSEIELKSDSRISIRGLPDCAIEPFGESGGGFVSGDGRWRVEKEGLGRYGISLVIEPGGSLQKGGYHWGSAMDILRRSPPHVLKITIGDPDTGESIRYERRAS